MRSYVRLHKRERTEGVQTLFNQQIQIITYPQRPMLFKIVNNLGLFVPPTPASRVEPDNIYMRKTPNGTEFVRKRQQQPKSKMPRYREPEPPRRGSLYNHHQEQRDILRRKSLLEAEMARRYQRRESLAHRKQQLQAELVARAARRGEEEEAARLEAEARFADREPRPYRRYAEPRESHLPELSPRPRSMRHRSVRTQPADPNFQNHLHRHHPRRSQTIYQEVDLETPYYSSRSPEQEYFPFSQEASLEPVPRHLCRRTSHQHSYHHQHDEALVSQRIIRHHGRRDTSSAPCRRRSPRFLIENVYNVEDRDRDDYLYY